VRIRCASGGDEQVACVDLSFTGRRAQPYSNLIARATFDGIDRGLEDHVDAVFYKDRADRIGDVQVLSGSELRGLLKHGYSAAEAPEGLCHFEADIAAAEHNQMPGNPIELKRLDMSQRNCATQPGNVGDGGVRAEIEKDALCLEAPCPTLAQPNFDRLGSDEATLAKDEVQVVGRKPRLVDRDQAVDHVALALSNRGHVHGPGAKAQSEFRCMANEVHNLRVVNLILAGQAGNVGTGTTDQSLLDHGDALSRSRQLPSNILSGFAAA